MKRSFFVLALAFVLMFLAACGEDTPATPEPVTPGEVTQPGDPPPVEPEIAVPTVRFDMEGREILIACWWDYLGVNFFEEPDIATSENYITDRLGYDNIMRIRNDYNVEFTNLVLAWGDMLPQLTTSVLAGAPMADMVFLGPEMTFAAIAGSLIQPVSQFAMADADIFGRQINVKPIVTFEGEIWSFGRAEIYAQGVGIGINLDIIDAIGVENPVDLLERGEWTWDNMRQIMLTATRDTDGDGLVDQFGISGDPGQILTNLIAANDGRMINPDTRTVSFDEPNTLRAIEFFHNFMINDRVWFYDGGGGDELGVWSRNFWAFEEGRSALFPIATYAAVESEAEIRLAVVPFPTGPDNTSGTVRIAGFSQGMTMPVGVPAADQVFYLYEQIFAWAGDDVELFNTGNLEYVRRGWQTEEDVQRVLGDIATNYFIDLGMVVPQYSWVVGAFLHDWWFNNMDIMPTLETHRPISQDRIDTAFAAFGAEIRRD